MENLIVVEKTDTTKEVSKTESNLIQLESVKGSEIIKSENLTKKFPFK